MNWNHFVTVNETVTFSERLKLLTEGFIPDRSAMFGATFDLITRVGLPYFLED